jgi:glycosyltransferase involved in cell wall biosynthesis
MVEAMAAGLPVVSGESGSLPEIVTDGVEGFLIPPGDVDAHADALLRLARDPDLRARMGMAGWARVRKDFSLDAEIRLLREFFGLEHSS